MPQEAESRCRPSDPLILNNLAARMSELNACQPEIGRRALDLLILRPVNIKMSRLNVRRGLNRLLYSGFAHSAGA